MRKYLLFIVCALLFIPAAYAVCPVCTVAVGAGLEGARLIGVDDVITGIWAGGLMLSVFFWTAGWLKKRGVNSVLWQIIVPFVFYYVLLAGVYLMPGIKFGANRLWGMDKFMLGTIVGTVAFYFGARWYAKIKKNNDGHAKFAFQKVIVPLSFLLVATAIFSAIIYL
ncbi:MAG TPA: hypothetical protein PKJ33_02025 [Alphaproteobacteria bacterium]|nr:hypothetical protein [Alphaproteobacteria bacterium]